MQQAFFKVTAQEIFDQLVEKRGLKEGLKDFLYPDYDAHLHDPFGLPDMQKAIERFRVARKRGETVAIYGDYDIDGLTATTVLHEALTTFGFRVETYIPDRFKEGYGMSARGIDAIAELGAQLIVTVDCGSRSVEEIAYAKEKGIDVVITDHHEVGARLPDAIAIVNAKREDSTYAFRDLAGVGVAFKLVTALQTIFDDLPPGLEKWLLDLVALGTVCDVVGLVDENRVLVRWGLEVIKKTRRPGLRALAQVSQTPLQEIDTTTFGFRFGPRLNASGRLEHARHSLDLLMASSASEALRMAQQLDELNTARRQEQAGIYEAAITQAEERHADPVLVLAHEEWSHGINGIVASKIVEKFHKPAFILQIMEDKIKGSARSFGDFHLANALMAVEQHTLTGGGHAFAAGVSLAPQKLESFRHALNEHYKQLHLKDQMQHLLARADLELASFTGLDDTLVQLIKQLEPFGHHNEAPLFAVDNVTLDSWRPVGADKRHAKATLRDTAGTRRDAIGFGIAESMPVIGSLVRVIFGLEHNVFNGRTTLQHRLVAVESMA